MVFPVFGFQLSSNLCPWGKLGAYLLVSLGPFGGLGSASFLEPETPVIPFVQGYLPTKFVSALEAYRVQQCSPSTSALQVCVCLPLFQRVTGIFFLSITCSRGVQSTVETAPNEAIHLCRKRGLISPVYLLL